MMRTPYSQPYLSLPDQLNLLKQRGLQVADDAVVEECLHRNGYYRLSAYWYPFREIIGGRLLSIIGDGKQGMQRRKMTEYPCGIMEPEEDTMQTALRVTTHVLPGHRLEIVAPELTDGDTVEVFVVMPRLAEPRAEVPVRGSIWQLIQSLPPGPRSAPTWEEIERTLQEDRDAWDR